MSRNKNSINRTIAAVEHQFIRHLKSTILAILLIFFSTLLLGNISWAQSSSSKAVPGRILVSPRSGLSDAAFGSIINKHGKPIGRISRIGVHIVQVPANAEDSVLRALSKNPHIQFAERDRLVKPSETIPNDPYFASQWHLSKIECPLAWDTSQGGGITVAILDTGVDSTHPDLVSKIVPGWNCYDNNSITSDVYGHGTLVAGTAAAATNNSLGVSSVAANALIMPVRISQPDGWAYWSTVATGITWAADHGADIANISYNGVSGSSTVQSAAQYMRNKGGIVVVAAGNSGGLEAISPNPYLISVSATTSSDQRASFSSYGDYVDLSAPGASIISTSRGGGYSTVSGTSFSSPTTAGVVALVMAANPALSPSQIENILFETANDLGAVGWDQYYGYGRVNAATAVSVAVQTPTQDTQAPSVIITSPDNGALVLGTIPVNVTASDNIGVISVDLYANGNFITSDALSPYQFSLDTTNFLDGTVTLKAYAFDAVGNQGTSSNVNVTVDNIPNPIDSQVPIVTITNPLNGSVVKGTVNIAVTASDDIGVTRIEGYIDGALKCSSASSSLGCSWNTRKASSGFHTISAKALDASGKVGTTSIQVKK